MSSLRASLLVFLTGLLVWPLRALVVDDTTTLNQTEPANGVPWNNVGQSGGASAVYLKNGWVVGARHVFQGSTSPQVVFGSNTYSGGTVFVLENSPGNPSDVVLFSIGKERPPGSVETGISTSTPSLLTDLTMIGYGARRSGGLTTISYSNGSANGYLWDGSPGTHKSWGTNRRSGVVSTVDVPGNNSFQAFPTSFIANGSSREAQATVGDSGGGVFAKSGNTWQLAGTMNAIGGYAGQQANTAANGNLTYVADMVSYAAPINDRLNSPAAAPVLNGISPTAFAASNNPQTLTFSGSSFVNGAKIQQSVAGNDFSFGDTANPAVWLNATTLTVSVSATAPATWNFRVVNPDGQPSASMVVTVFPQTYANWLSGFPSLAGDGGLATADPDADGLVNLQEYAFGSDPTRSDADGRPLQGVENVSGETYLTLTYHRDTTKGDVTIQAQATTDLTQPWTDLGDTLQSTNGTLQLRKASISLAWPMRFLRIRVAR